MAIISKVTLVYLKTYFIFAIAKQSKRHTV